MLECYAASRAEWIPACAHCCLRKILCHSRGGRNLPHPSFPRRRESTIPAHAGIHRSTTPAPEKSTPSFPQRRESIPAVIPAEVEIYPIRHSREGGNPQFPRMREFTVPLPRHLRKILRHSRKDGNDVEVVLRGNEVSGRSGWCFFVEFPRTRELWIPAFAGMTEYFRVPSRE